MLQRLKCASFSLALLCMVAVNLSQAKTDIDKLLDSAAGVWLFYDGKGEVARDISKEGNDGKLVKSPKWIQGEFGKALEFNGKDNCVQTEKNYSITSKSFPFMLDQDRQNNGKSNWAGWTK